MKKSAAFFTAFLLAACTLSPLPSSMYFSKNEEASLSPPPLLVEKFAYGRSLLSGHQLKAYDEILKNFQNWQENAAGYGDISHRIYFKLASQGINIPNSLEFAKIAGYVGNDYPEFYPANFSSAPRDITFLGGDLDIFYILGIPSYISRPLFNQDSRLMENQAAAFLSGLKPGMTEAQKARYLHDRFLEHVSYSRNSAYRVADAHGALISGKALCEGYARGYLYLLQRAGLKAFYTEGYVQTSTIDDTWGLHAWVGIQIDGEWYYTDPTNDDGIAGSGYHHDFFLLGQDDFNKSYKYDHGAGNRASFPLPAVSAARYPQSKSLY